MLTFGYGAFGVNDKGQEFDNTPRMNIIIDCDMVTESHLKVDIGLEEIIESYLNIQVLMPQLNSAIFTRNSIYKWGANNGFKA